MLYTLKLLQVSKRKLCKLSTVASDSDQESKRGHKTFDFKEAVYVNMYIFDENSLTTCRSTPWMMKELVSEVLVFYQ